MSVSWLCPELRSLDPSDPGAGPALGSLPEGGPQWLPAPTSDVSGGIRYRIRRSDAWTRWGLPWLHYLLDGTRLLTSSPGRWLTGFSLFKWLRSDTDALRIYLLLSLLELPLHLLGFQSLW